MTAWQRAWSTIAAAGLLGAATASCNLVAGLDKIEIVGGAGGATPCSSDAACDDQDPCTTDTCGPDGVCVLTPLDGLPAPDDGDDCTFDACTDGVETHVPNADGAACQALGVAGVCHAGHCAPGCESDDQCISTDPCVIGSCDKGTAKCVFMPAPNGTRPPGVAQTPGDCHVRACQAGALTDEADDNDVPATPTDCDTEVCTDGAPSNPPKALGEACSTYLTDQPGFCDGDGACVQCAQDADCSGTADDCQHPACVNFACTTAFAPDLTPIDAQNPGDCQMIVCDGAGGTKSVVDDTDKPLDGTVCTNDICTGGVPSHAPNPGVHCETATSPFVCNAMGQCGCQSNADCTAPNTCGGGNPGMAGVCGCAKTTCAAEGATCGTISDACFATLNCNNGVKNGGETDVDCGGPTSGCATRCANGKKCGVGSDCASGFCVDGVCCNSACSGPCQACSAALKQSGSGSGTCGNAKNNQPDPRGLCAATVPASCGTDGRCSSGACRMWAAGTECTAPTCSGATLTSAKTCDGGGTCSLGGGTSSCAGHLICQSTTSCLTACGSADPVGDAECVSGYYCDGLGGGACQPKRNTFDACTRGGECQSGMCIGGNCF